MSCPYNFITLYKVHYAEFIIYVKQRHAKILHMPMTTKINKFITFFLNKQVHYTPKKTSSLHKRNTFFQP